jgi:hypothetical protein
VALVVVRPPLVANGRRPTDLQKRLTVRVRVVVVVVVAVVVVVVAVGVVPGAERAVRWAAVAVVGRADQGEQGRESAALAVGLHVAARLGGGGASGGGARVREAGWAAQKEGTLAWQVSALLLPVLRSSAQQEGALPRQVCARLEVLALPLRLLLRFLLAPWAAMPYLLAPEAAVPYHVGLSRRGRWRGHQQWQVLLLPLRLLLAP